MEDRTVCEAAKEGRCLCASSKDLLRREDLTGQAEQAFPNLMPLMNTAFVPGKCLEYIRGMKKGPKKDISGYRTSAWINTCLTTSPVYDVVGPDAVKFLNSICVNDFTKLTTKGMRHAILCNDKGQILTDGVSLL